LYKEGDKVIIRQNNTGHNFNIGEEVTILKVGNIEYKAENKEWEYWYIDDKTTQCDIGTIAHLSQQGEQC